MWKMREKEKEREKGQEEEEKEIENMAKGEGVVRIGEER